MVFAFRLERVPATRLDRNMASSIWVILCPGCHWLNAHASTANANTCRSAVNSCTGSAPPMFLKVTLPYKQLKDPFLETAHDFADRVAPTTLSRAEVADDFNHGCHELDG
jgi:hypothetical protein